MTAELNSHQRVSYYTGVKLIRHHQNQSSSNNTATSNNSSTANPTNTGAGGSSVNTSGGYYSPHSNHHHHPHFQVHGPPPPHHQHPPPPLPPHHPGHYHLPCPTGPPHIQHPGGAFHLNNHHGPPHHPNNNGHQHFGHGGGGSNQATRLYAGSPLIRSSAFHSANGNSGNHKRSYKHHNRSHQINHGHYHNAHNNSSNKFGLNQGNHHLHHHHHTNNIIIGGSCSSGTNSSSSSNEHLNSFQSPTGSPTTPAKLDITPLKLSSSSASSNREDSSNPSSSNNSSPGPEGPPSPSAPSASPSSSDGNKDLDHFYFLDEHWKPNSHASNIQNNENGNCPSNGDLLDNMSSSTSSIMSSQWTNSSSGSPSPPAPANTTTTLTMMVDQFFSTRESSQQAFSNLVDANNNVVGASPTDLNETRRDLHPRGDQNDLYSTFNSSGFLSCGNSSTGASGLFNFGAENNNTTGGGIHNNSRSPLSGGATTVVNVETQIGTFNGQRDLEIRLCFIRGDRTQQEKTLPTEAPKLYENQNDISYLSCKSEGKQETVLSVIGDPFCGSVQTKNKELVAPKLQFPDATLIATKNHDKVSLPSPQMPIAPKDPKDASQSFKKLFAE